MARLLDVGNLNSLPLPVSTFLCATRGLESPSEASHYPPPFAYMHSRVRARPRARAYTWSSVVNPAFLPATPPYSPRAVTPSTNTSTKFTKTKQHEGNDEEIIPRMLRNTPYTAGNAAPIHH